MSSFARPGGGGKTDVKQDTSAGFEQKNGKGHDIDMDATLAERGKFPRSGGCGTDSVIRLSADKRVAAQGGSNDDWRGRKLIKRDDYESFGNKKGRMLVRNGGHQLERWTTARESSHVHAKKQCTDGGCSFMDTYGFFHYATWIR